MTSTLKTNGRRLQLFRQMEDDLNFLGEWNMTSKFQANGKQPQLFRQMEDNLKCLWKSKMNPPLASPNFT